MTVKRLPLALPLLALPFTAVQASPRKHAQAPAAVPAAPPVDPLPAKVGTLLAGGPAGTRYGLLVTDTDGKQILAIAPDDRFIPASNTKMFTTSTAFSELPLLDQAARGTGVRLEPGKRGRKDVVLYGRGDARLSSAADCKLDCLATLADAIAAKTHKVNNVIGDDTLFPDERWSPGMSWNNIQGKYGTGISALTIDDNELPATVTPATVGLAPTVDLPGYYTIDNRATTVAGAGHDIEVFREPNSYVVRLTGSIGADAKPATLVFGIDDPARYAAWRMRALLEARGVKVRGDISARHRTLLPTDNPAKRAGAPATPPPLPEMLAELPPLPLADDVHIIQKVSQNLHAELLLRRVSRQSGSGSIADGEVMVDSVMARAGLPAGSYSLSDGSGMSSYNRITPRAAVTLLTWIARQPWSDAWRSTLPVGGIDGTLRARFHGTALDGKLFAKTGSLNASRALSGYMIAKSGKTLIFSALANDMPPGRDDDATAAVDRALVAIAEAE
jgi:D-alanyl-D-alanine carboxypeptidase/D-alanyl-D-alanine-endopeptidase (penicillin-binding protein 4)